MITENKSSKVSDRILSLRERVLSTKPSVCTERAKFYTQIYQENEDKPVIIKRALALEKTLKEMTIFIDEGELIVGNQSSQNRAAPIFPEYAVDWLPAEMDELISFKKQRIFLLFPIQVNSEKPNSPTSAILHKFNTSQQTTTSTFNFKMNL